MRDIKVALIADQFTYDSYKYEFNAITINPDDWKEKFKTEKPDIFLCESAWDGHNFEGLYGPWREKIYQKLTRSQSVPKRMLMTTQMKITNKIVPKRHPQHPPRLVPKFSCPHS